MEWINLSVIVGLAVLAAWLFSAIIRGNGTADPVLPDPHEVSDPSTYVVDSAPEKE